ncbi:AAA family ATPase [Mesorhizobium sp. AD1-1]|uniref:AAA family ATPase n=1 Tax=Mesorhizobium sp. AD1-1 TaxID=2876621 RepID=UPI001CCA290D|nr:AAA family ATPase [Mesorhizobium sp. AD1-1]MBZ9717513.1 AAA family ATPase [Mesorhizobium sp. AD1-1]
MPFQVIPPGRVPHDSLGFILRQDNWNDFSYQTLYQLYHGIGSGDPTLIGDVKILRRGQAPSDTLQLKVGPIGDLDENFCSIGQSLDYYERLATLDEPIRISVLSGLRDVIKHPDLVKEFEEEEGWRTSLFRTLDRDFVPTARALVERDYTALPGSDLRFSFHAAGWEDRIDFNFSAPPSQLNDIFAMPGENRPKLPARLAVLIGRNGSGKSTLLARLARVAHASARDRAKLENLGTLDPGGLGFTRIVTISYSAFDSFAAPGITSEERLQVAKEIRSGTGRYMFCGLRDLALEMDEPASSSDGETELDRLPTNRIKSLDRLTDEFAEAINRIEQADRLGTLRRCSLPLFLDPSLYSSNSPDIMSFLSGNVRQKFHSLSTGHKIAFHVIASVVSYAERKALILFDEPETHLHPPLLAALMHSLRFALNELQAFAVVATHSPVVLQETLASQVHKIVRVGESGRVFPPEIETFGESIGAITNEVFALDTEATDYHSILRALARSYRDLEPIELLFPQGLSTQARAYVMSILASTPRSET